MVAAAPMVTLPDPLPDHPRLLVRSADWVRLRTQIRVDAVSAKMWSTLVRRAESIRTQPPLTHAVDDTGRLLMVGREALERITVFAMVARVSGDRRHAARAIDEMLALSRFPNWGPRSFLEVAETCLAVSIGYDWLYDDLSAAQRDEIVAALIGKAIAPSLDDAAPGNWWIHTEENWAQVCHGGLSAAAIVIADREPELTQRILTRAVSNLDRVGASYAPDGAYPEGPMYWSYGTGYHVILAAALERLCGTTLGVDDYPGFNQTAEYLNNATAPSGDYFNYCDCAPRRRLQAQLFWMSSRYGHPEWLAHDIASLAGDLAEYEADPGVQYWYYDMVALALLWWRPELPPPATAEPFSWHGRGSNPVAIYQRRSPNGSAFYFAIKGGTVGISHTHMDVGSFVLEANGERWAVDPGMQDYASLERQGVDLWNERESGSQRWQVFRIGPEAHSILRVDGAPQHLHATAEITSFTAGGCTVDLTPIYAPRLEVIRRSVTIGDAGRLVLTDRWEAPTPVELSWQWMTCAEVTRHGSTLLLAQNGKALRLEIDQPADFTCTVDDMSFPQAEFDAPNPGLKRIRLTVPRARSGRIVVSLDA